MSCDRLQRERLLAIADGAAPDEHELTCPDCIEARRKYDAVGVLVAGARADRELPAAWFDATLTMIDVRTRHRRRRWLVASAGLAAAAAVALLLWPRHQANPVVAPVLAIRVDRGGAPLRGSSPHPGDLLVVHGRAVGQRHLELRVYRADHEVVMRCAEDLPCRPSGDAIEATVPLAQVGRYRAVLLSSDRTMPAAGATLDQAAAQVNDDGGVATLSEPIDVL